MATNLLHFDTVFVLDVWGLSSFVSKTNKEKNLLLIRQRSDIFAVYKKKDQIQKVKHFFRTLSFPVLSRLIPQISGFPPKIHL